MHTFSSHILCIVLSTLLGSACSRNSGENSQTNPNRSDSLFIADAWVRPAAEGTNSAAYLTIYNPPSRADTLSSLSTEAASIAEIHKSYEKEGMTGMRPAGQLVIEPGGRLELEPGGFHVMLMQVKRPLLPGDSLLLRLNFTQAGTREVAAVVQ